jgi:hypothetical protein
MKHIANHAMLDVALICGLFLGTLQPSTVSAQVQTDDKANGERQPSTIQRASFEVPRMWEYGAPLIAPEIRESNPSRAQKDPTVVFYEGQWHVFMTVKLPGKSAIEHCSFKKWEDAHASLRTILRVSTNDYYGAPQVFYFTLHKKWHLVYQMGVPGANKMWVAYSTTTDITNPNSWTQAQPMLDGGKDDPRKVGGLDYWIICDDQRAYLFLTSLDGKMWRLWTRLVDFPRGFDHCELALEAKIFEASHTYKLKGLGKYLTVIEENGRRYYKAYLADRLDGKWVPVADTADRPFAGWKNVRPAAGVEPWTDNISHGELIRDGCDESLTVDPSHLRFVFQGMWDKDKSGQAYGQFQWRIGMLTPVAAGATPPSAPAVQDGARSRPMGPLRVCAVNSRYFADPTGRPVYLTGSHTWESLQDGVLSNYTAVTQPFDYAGYLNLLQTNHHNFIRLWRWELTTHEPQPWQRTGPGPALDGKPKFDLRRFNQSYFDRLRSRIIAARERGIYVSVMLFEDWIFMNKRKDHPVEQHPFHKGNNVSGISGDPNGDGWGVEIHTLQVPKVLEVQKAYVRKVIETVNDLDNVLYEICNEGVRHTREWQYEMVRFVKDVEAKLPKQHPVGMTSVGDMNEDCLKSTADWTSLATTGWDKPKDPWTSDPPAATGQMVCLLDTDHIGWKIFINDAAFTRAWVWKSFTRGHSTLLMENLDNSAGWTAGRAAMGHTRRLAERVNLATLHPHPELASTRYCLANPGQEYVVYLPPGGDVTVDLSAASGTLAVEWIHAAAGTIQRTATVAGGAQRAFQAPFSGDAVLYLRKSQGNDAR